jgi:hypothetical protein
VHTKTQGTRQTKTEPEPRWPAALALLAVGGLYVALPESLTVGPSWLLLVLVCVLLVPAIISNRVGSAYWNQLTGYVVNGLVTADLIFSLYLLVRSLPRHELAPLVLLGSAAALWGTNILVFALWYWRLDAGGPNAREMRGTHTRGAFLFPQMTISPAQSMVSCDEDWAPEFIDYLFLAYNTSTAFSPTDVPVLSRWAKVLMMVQSTISFATVALLAARAVNIL